MGIEAHCCGEGVVTAVLPIVKGGSSLVNVCCQKMYESDFKIDN